MGAQPGSPSCKSCVLKQLAHIYSTVVSLVTVRRLKSAIRIIELVTCVSA